MFDGPINGERFRAYVEQFLVPTLKPNDIVILDNLGSHKGKAVRKAVKAAGARLLFLPKYSPDLNPIEQVFAKIKGFVRKAAPRTLDAIYHAIAQALAAIKPAECKNYLAGGGVRRPTNSMATHCGSYREQEFSAMVRAPTPEEEDRRLSRERRVLLKERVQHSNRIKGLLFGQGVTGYEPLRRDRRQRLVG